MWDDLSDKAQADVTRLVAGVRQGNVLNALLTNMPEGIRATEVALNSAGSALAENQKYMDSIAGKTAKMSAGFQQLSSNLIDSGLVKAFIDFGIILLEGANFADGLVIKLVALSLILPVILGMFKTISGVTLFANITSQVTAFYTMIKMLPTALGLLSTSTEVQAVAEAKLTAATDANTAAIIKNNIAWLKNPFVLAVAAIAAVVVVVDLLTTSVTEQRDKVVELKLEYNSLTNTLKELTTELDGVIARITELESKGNLTFIEQEELSKLKDTNSELEARIALLKKEEEIAAKVLARESVKLYQATYGEDARFDSSSSGSINEPQIESLKRVRELRDSASNSKDFERFDRQLADIENRLLTSSKELQEMYDNISLLEEPTEAQRIILEAIEDELHLINSAIIPEKWNEINFNKIFNSSDFDATREKIIELAQSGEVSADILTENFGELSSALQDVGISADEAAQHINATFNGVSSTVMSEVEAIENVVEGYSKYNEVLNSLDDNLQAIVSIQKSLSDGNTLTYDQLSQLLTIYPELNGMIDLNAKNYGITIDVLDEVRAKVYKTTEDKIRFQIEDTRTTIEQTRARIESYKAEMQMIIALGNVAAKVIPFLANANSGANVAMNEVLKSMEASLVSSENELVSLEARLDAVGKMGTSSFKDIQAATKSAADAQKEYEQSLKASQSAINSLLSLTMSMLKQRYSDSKKDINNEKQAVKNRYDEEKKYLDELAKERKKQFDADKKALQDQTNAYKKQIDMQLEALKLKKEEANYQKQLLEKQTSDN